MSKSKITCFITGKKRPETPEEKVRQKVAKKLVDEYGYPKENIDIEFSIQRGSKKTGEAIDIVVFHSDKKKQTNIYLIIEVKPPTIKTYDDQVFTYASTTTASWCVWTNGSDWNYWKTNVGTKKALSYTEVWDFPHYANKLGSLKKTALIQPSNIIEVFQKLHDYIYANANIKKPDRITTNIINVLFCKIYDELSTDEYCKFYIRLDDNDEPDVNKTYKEIKNLFNEVKTRYKDIFYESDSIEFNKETVIQIVAKFQKYSFLFSKVDSIGAAFEVFTNESLKEDNGQFFTPRQVVKFIVDFLNPKPEEYIIDPACGSGGFLIDALKEVGDVLDKTLKHLPHDQLVIHKRNLFAKYFFGIDQERDLVKITKAYMSIVGDGSGGVFSENSLAEPKKWESVNRTELKFNQFNVLITNPPFGKDIKVTGKLLEQYDLAQFWEFDGKNYALPKKKKFRGAIRPSVLFIERCYQLLNKKNGRMGIVLPVGDISNDEDEHIRTWLLDKFKITGIVQLPSETFQPYTGTQTCIVFAETNQKKEKDYQIFMAQVDKVGKNQRGKDLFKRTETGSLIEDKDGNTILDNDLVDIIVDYEKFKVGKKFKPGSSFIVPSKELSKSLLPNYHNPKNSLLIKKSSKNKVTHDKLINLCTKVYTPPRTKRIYVEPQFGVAFLSGTNITQLIPQNIKYISKTETKSIDQYIVEKGDIVITRVGTMGIVRLIGSDLAGYAVSDNINIIKVNKDKIDPEYLFSILNSKVGVQSVKKVSKGSVQNYNTPKAIRNIDVPIVPDPDYTTIVDTIKKAEKERSNAVMRILKADDIFNSYI
jgi:type I restriction enzyme M protein